MTRLYAVHMYITLQQYWSTTVQIMIKAAYKGLAMQQFWVQQSSVGTAFRFYFTTITS